MKIFSLQRRIVGYPGVPTLTQIRLLKELGAALQKRLQTVYQLQKKDLPQLNSLLLKYKIPYIEVLTLQEKKPAKH